MKFPHLQSWMHLSLLISVYAFQSFDEIPDRRNPVQTSVIVWAMKRPLCNVVSCLSYSSSSLNALKCGDVLKQAKIFSISDISEYSKLTHDHNPLHFDLEFAKKAGFSDVPVPGMLVASLFPRIIASNFVSVIALSLAPLMLCLWYI